MRIEPAVVGEAGREWESWPTEQVADLRVLYVLDADSFDEVVHAFGE